MNKIKSMGEIAHPAVSASLRSDGTACLTVRSGCKLVRIRGDAFCTARNLIAMAKEIARQQRQLAVMAWKDYLTLKKMTGYDPGNGEE